MHLHERMDNVFNSAGRQHRTLRTLFDPASAEWNQTTMEEKIEILKKIIDSGENLNSILIEYRSFYKEMNREDIAKDSEIGLALILQHILSEIK